MYLSLICLTVQLIVIHPVLEVTVSNPGAVACLDLNMHVETFKVPGSRPIRQDGHLKTDRTVHPSSVSWEVLKGLPRRDNFENDARQSLPKV